MKAKQIRNQHILQFLIILLLIVVINFLGSFWNVRWDVTEDKRHSLSETTTDMLKELDDVMYIKVYLDGNELPIGFRQLKRSVRELLDDYRRYSHLVEYEFVDLSKEKDIDTRYEIYNQLQEKGLEPTQLEERNSASYKEQVIFPSALIRYKEAEFPVNFLENERGSSTASQINKSIARLEQHFTNAMMKLTNPEIKKVAFLEGYDELDEYQTMDAMIALSDYYQIERLNINGVLGALDEYEAIVIAKPNSRVSEKDKFIIDQYIMNGGKALWLVEWMQMDMDSLTDQYSSMALMRDINLDDLLFNYGVRINPDLVQDLNCLSIPVAVNSKDGKPQFEPRAWYFFPALLTENSHIINRNISVLRTQFASSIDSVNPDMRVTKTPILRTSEFSRALSVPVNVSLGIVRNPPDPRSFNQGEKTVAMLLEGEFPSNFDMRIPPEIAVDEDIDFKTVSVPTKQIVVSDGDVIRNFVRKEGNRHIPFQLGEDKYYQNQFTPGNKEFILNSMNYLCGDEALIELRMRELKLRTLDRTKVMNKGLFWAVFNSVVPIILIILFGLIVFFVRKQKYGKHTIQKQ
jgi:ABC-2 type transport system permease protein